MIFAKFNIILFQFLSFLFIIIKDRYKYYKEKQYKNFNGFGVHIYTGIFGSGKTSSLVYDAYKIAKKFPQVTILTNMQLANFPEHTNIINLTSFQQIIDCPSDTLIIIDEMATIFNSRDWKSEGIPATLLGTLLQIRKERKMLYGTSQRFNFVDSLIRQVTFSVRECKCILGRWNIVSIYDGMDYESKNLYSTVHPPKIINMYGFIQTDAIRNLYDTTEMVSKMKKAKYISDAEVLQKQDNKVLELINNK